MTATTESESSESMSLEAMSSLQRSAIIGSTTSTVPVAKAVTMASPASLRISR